MFLFLFLITDLYSLLPAVIAKICIPSVELAVPIEVQTKEAKVEIEAHLLTAEAKINKYSTQFKAIRTTLCLLLIKSFWFISSMK